MSTAQALLIFVGVPLAVVAIVALLVYGPSALRHPRYKPGRTEWSYGPLWVGGPADPTVALTTTPSERVQSVRGGGAGAGW